MMGASIGTAAGTLGPAAVAQIEVSGGSVGVAVAALVTFFVALALSVVVTYQCVRGYRQSQRRPMLLLAVGVFLLASAPMFLRLLLGNLNAVPPTTRIFVVAVTELAGLLTILYVVYDP
ncbi:DUF7521 family protein [Halostella litorea]|uniref:DUF7521 family protein n=1 Tax=Halostella litorea TaxID=2528831 RepID=UPI00109314EA|nr:hypothetical protein [Halostella litorea]